MTETTTTTIPAGWKLVPRVPTERMISAGLSARITSVDPGSFARSAAFCQYQGMVEAAPAAPSPAPAAPSAAQWMPIETAPKDGTWVLIAAQDRDDISTSKYDNEREAWVDCWDDESECFQYRGNRHAPKYWMPLPAHPDTPGAQPAQGGSVSDGSDLPPGLVLVETPYRDAPDKWMLIEMTAPGRAKVVTGGYIETEAEGVAHAHSFAGIALSAARASAPAAPEVAQDRVAELEAEIEAWQMASGLCVPPEDKGGDPGGVKPSHLAAHLNELNARLAGYHDNTATFDGPVYSAALRSAGEGK